VPNPADPPRGCLFNTRCRLAFDRCLIEEHRYGAPRPPRRLLPGPAGERAGACALAPESSHCWHTHVMDALMLTPPAPTAPCTSVLPQSTRFIDPDPSGLTVSVVRP
jgi:hypothetical protein